MNMTRLWSYSVHGREPSASTMSRSILLGHTILAFSIREAQAVPPRPERGAGKTGVHARNSRQ